MPRHPFWIIAPIKETKLVPLAAGSVEVAAALC